MKNALSRLGLVLPSGLPQLITGILILSGANATAGSASAANNADYAIPDGTGVYVHSPITISSAPSGATVTRIDWSFNITHADGRDLDVDLNDHTQTAAYKADLWRGTFAGGSDSGANPARAGTITSGSLIGLPVNQTWYLAAADVAAIDAGYINSWSITVYWNDSQPNLALYQPAGWSDKIVVSKVTGTSSDSSPLYTTDTLYADWAVINSGSGATGARFYTELYVDGTLRTSWYTDPPLNAGSWVNIQDYNIGSLSAGNHTIKVKTDSTGAIAESNENDNEYTKTISVTSPVQPPNLTPYAPAGWSDKIVVSKVTGTSTDSSPLYTTDTLYVDWAVINSGSSPTAARFYTELYVDGTLRTSWSSDPPLNVNSWVNVLDCNIGSLSAGNHTIKVKTDSTGAIAESNENDNEYTKTISVTSPVQPPNLAPYQPAGWSDKIVVSKVTGTSTDSSPLYTTDTLYVDWAVVNNGAAATASRFYTELYVDGVLKTSWYSDPPLNVNGWVSVTDYSIGSLSAGAHTIKIKTDSTGAIAESNETDNEYTKNITVTVLSQPNLAPYQPAGWSDKIVVSKVTGTSTDSSPLYTTDTLYVDWAVVNNGTATTASRLYTELYVDNVLKTSWYSDPPLNVNGWVSVTDYSIGSLSAGAHTIKVKTDSTGAIAESNETDNEYTKNITVTVLSQPNLTPFQPAGWSDKIVVSKVTGTSTDSSPLYPTDTLYVDWAVVNSGAAATASRFYTELYVDGVLKTSWYTDPPLNVNGSASVTDYSIGSLTVGPHTVKIKTDSTGIIAESNESDNEYTKTFTVGAASTPNLAPYQPSGWSDRIVVSRVTGNNTDSTGLTTADPLYVDWAVINSGNAVVSSTFYTYLYVDGTLKNSWYTSPPLNPNNYTTVFDYALGSLSAGSHTISITTDATGVITESNESDNSYTKTINVTSTALPDFVITAISLSPPTPQPGQAYTAYVTVKNQGSGSGDARWLDVWANQASSQSCGADGNTWTSVAVLTANQSKTFTFGMTAPSTAGTYTFRAFVDSACQTTESNDSNNQSILGYNVIAPAQLPDFVVTAISLSPPSPLAGQAFTANVTVKNQGAAAGSGGWLDVWANQPAAPACGTDGNTWASVGTLSTGQSQTYTLVLTAPAAAGSYTFRAFVDSYCQTAESNEGNNQSTLAYTVGAVSQPPDFVVTAITFSPPQPVGGQPFTAYVTVKNQGSGAGDGKYLDVWVNQPSPQSCGASGDQYQTIGALAPAQTVTRTFNLTAPANGAPWTFRAFADSGCQTAESNDANNQKTVSYGVNPVQLPDFIITGVSISPTAVKPGDAFTAYVTVKNQGLGSGDASWLDVWANRSTAPTCGESGDAFQQVGALAAGASKTLTLSLTAGLAGFNTLLAFVDSACQTTETNEGNNQSTLVYTVAVPLDLEISIQPAAAFPDATYLDKLHTGMQRAANLLSQLTDGQMTIRSATVYRDGANWHTVDLQIANSPFWPENRNDWALTWPPEMRVITFGTFNGQVSIPATGGAWIGYDWDEPSAYRTLIHEMGHYFMKLEDEYGHFAIPGLNWDFVSDPADNTCTGNSYKCLMCYQYGPMNICVESNHDANNAQGQVYGHSCWWTINHVLPLVSMPSSVPTAIDPSSDPSATSPPGSAMTWTVLPALP